VEVWQTSNVRRLRLGEEKKKEERRTNHSMKIYMVSLLHRATYTVVTETRPVRRCVTCWHATVTRRHCDGSSRPPAMSVSSRGHVAAPLRYITPPPAATWTRSATSNTQTPVLERVSLSLTCSLLLGSFVCIELDLS